MLPQISAHHCLLPINIKWRAYGQRIREVEYASFSPLVFSATGGLAHEATIFYKHLASLLSNKWGDN